MTWRIYLSERLRATIKSNFYHFSQIQPLVKIHWITKCTTTGYFYPFSSILKKREEEKENEVAKPVLIHF